MTLPITSHCPHGIDVHECALCLSVNLSTTTAECARLKIDLDVVEMQCEELRGLLADCRAGVPSDGAIYSAAPAPAPKRDTQRTPQIGDEVEYSSNGKYGEWKEGGPYYFAGAVAKVGGSISVTISDTWPIQHLGNLTDGFDVDDWKAITRATPAAGT